ncbi:MAG: adenylate/guanylate cyclase domain-containing protein [Oligoflexia bacterium]|nr:adenylate/guanylate cyclase domain-containing protein [Oligoflexia bacterium]
MLSKILIRISGLIIIIGISIVSIFIFQYSRDLKDVQATYPFVRTITTIVSFFEDRFYDFRMNQNLEAERAFSKNKIEPTMVLLAIDDDSLKKIGRWPWSRSIIAKIIKKLHKFEAKVVTFDAVYPEEEKYCAKESPDQDMANAIKEFQSTADRKVILGYASTIMGDPDGLPKPPDNLYMYAINNEPLDKSNALNEKMVLGSSIPIKAFMDVDVMFAYINAEPDPDGIFRHYPLVQNFDSTYFPSLALASYQALTGDSTVLGMRKKTNMFSGQNLILKLKKGEADVNNDGEAKVRWYGNRFAFNTISVYKILDAKDDDIEFKKILKDKLVFIGSTAFAAHDIRHTPVDPVLPGVYFHMNVVSMLNEGKFFKSDTESMYWSWGILIFGTIFVVIFSMIGNALLDTVIVSVFFVLLFLFDTYYLLPKGCNITLFFAFFSMGGTFIWNILLNFYLANKDKKFLKSAFGSYISPELIDEMYKRGEPPKLGGEVGLISAYFTDIQGFSTFSEKLTAPQLVELLNEYLTVMTDILLAHKGTLDKYEGDAIIAFFGAPMPLADHAVNACLVALRMQENLLTLREKWKSEGEKWPIVVHDMRMRIGINSGEIVTGNMGSRSRMNYTMMGDSVNLAARLEECAKQYGIFVQISEYTKKLTGDAFEMRELDTMKVVGKSEPVTTYDLLGEKDKTHEDLIALKNLFHQGIKLYKEKKWDEAIATFEKSLEYEYKRYPDLKHKTNPSKVYIERCNLFKENPPPVDWNGVFTLSHK